MLEFKNNLPFIENTSLHDITKVCQTPFYVYSQKVITQKVEKTKQVLGENIFFSVKANSNQAILKLMQSLNIGADVVSAGELKRALSAGFPSNKIIFEGVGKSKHDLIFAIDKNIHLINTESIEEIKLLQKLAKEKNRVVNIGVRLNPNIDGETISKISTGKKTDKFGIEINEVENVVNLIANCSNLNLISISCHIGSQISKIEVYKRTFIEMKNTADKFKSLGINIKHVDLGGGFHVKYNQNDPEFKIENLKNELDKCFSKTSYDLSFEPGRYLVAEAGLLVTSIINTKQNGGINYLIVDAGMNTLIRPAMYGAYHDIQSINSNTNNLFNYNIAGPICESSDIFLENISLPKQNVDDLLVINNVGAYGKVMSSTYNTRPLPSEVLVNNENFAIVYSADKIEKNIEEDIIPNWL